MSNALVVSVNFLDRFLSTLSSSHGMFGSKTAPGKQGFRLSSFPLILVMMMCWAVKFECVYSSPIHCRIYWFGCNFIHLIALSIHLVAFGVVGLFYFFAFGMNSFVLLQIYLPFAMVTLGSVISIWLLWLIPLDLLNLIINLGCIWD